MRYRLGLVRRVVRRAQRVSVRLAVGILLRIESFTHLLAMHINVVTRHPANAVGGHRMRFV